MWDSCFVERGGLAAGQRTHFGARTRIDAERDGTNAPVVVELLCDFVHYHAPDRVACETPSVPTGLVGSALFLCKIPKELSCRYRPSSRPAALTTSCAARNDTDMVCLGSHRRSPRASASADATSAGAGGG